SRIRPFPLCIIALSRNASCLHLSFNYSQSAFFGQGPPRAVTLQGPTTTARPMRYAAPWVSGDQLELVGELFVQSSAAVATSREGHRLPRSGLEGQQRKRGKTKIALNYH